MATDRPPVSSRHKWTALSNTTLLAAAASWMRGAMPPGPLDDDVGEALEETVLA